MTEQELKAAMEQQWETLACENPLQIVSWVVWQRRLAAYTEPFELKF